MKRQQVLLHKRMSVSVIPIVLTPHLSEHSQHSIIHVKYYEFLNYACVPCRSLPVWLTLRTKYIFFFWLAGCFSLSGHAPGNIERSAIAM